jgi:hypothetical protein
MKYDNDDDEYEDCKFYQKILTTVLYEETVFWDIGQSNHVEFYQSYQPQLYNRPVVLKPFSWFTTIYNFKHSVYHQ